MPDASKILRFKDVHLHDYGKQPRAGRKLGHVTVLANDDLERRAKLEALEEILVKCGAMPRLG
jgi:5-(carboxyamino)imidazole ribonucleotide synthase